MSLTFKSDLGHFLSAQSKKVERDAVSSSESEEDKEDKKITVAYKSTRSAVSYDLNLTFEHMTFF